MTTTTTKKNYISSTIFRSRNYDYNRFKTSECYIQDAGYEVGPFVGTSIPRVGAEGEP